MSMSDNRGIGDNEAADYAKEESLRLKRDYAELSRTVVDLLAEYETIPEVLANQQDKDRTKSLIKAMRDAAKRLLGIHELEKLPHYRKGQACDQHFFGEIDLLTKRDRRSNDGAADKLNNRLTDYDVKELARENARRRQAALDARKEADRIAAELDDAEWEAAGMRKRQEEADAAAARARKPENVQAHKAEAAAASKLASEATDRVIEKKAELAVADHQAQDAHISTLARPADVMRQRGADGTLSTMGDVKFAEIINKNELALEPLRPYLSLAVLETALRGYASNQGYSNDPSVQIKGAKFGKRPKSQVR